MRNSNGGRVVTLSHYRTRSLLQYLVIGLVLVVAVLLFGVFRGWITLPTPTDAGPTELTAHQRTTLIEKVDFQCFAAVSSVFPVTAYNPGWKWGFISGGQAYVAFDIVGDLDLCVWADGYELSVDESGKILVVDIQEIDIRRPRIDFNPRQFDGITYQTLALASASEEKLANANIDRVLWEAGRNLFSGDDSTYIDELQDMLLLFGANQLSATSCYPQAIEVMEQSILEHYQVQAKMFGFSDASVTLPYSVEIPQHKENFDPGNTELSVIGEENCFTLNAT